MGLTVARRVLSMRAFAAKVRGVDPKAKPPVLSGIGEFLAISFEDAKPLPEGTELSPDLERLLVEMFGEKGGPP